MVGRLPINGIKPTAHFAHSSEGGCLGETALHKAAKEAIAGAHRRGVLRRLAWRCPWCNWWEHQTDLSDLELRVEDSPCALVTSDVLGRDDAGVPRVAIEVVVTHPLEETTLARYRAQDISVFVLSLQRGHREPLSWGIVNRLALGGVDCLRVDHRLHAVERSSCVNCQRILCEEAALKDALARQARARQWRAWLEAWRTLEKEAARLHEEQLRESERALARIVEWWGRWSRAWIRTGDEMRIDRDRERAWWKTWSSAWGTPVYVAWWNAWSASWRGVTGDYEWPAAWWRKWDAGWKGTTTYSQAWWQAWGTAWKKLGADIVKEEKARMDATKRVKQGLDGWIEGWLKLGERRRQAVLVREANTLFAQGRHTEALVLLQQAGDVLHSPCPECAVNRGQSCIQFGTGGQLRSVPHEGRV